MMTSQGASMTYQDKVWPVDISLSPNKAVLTVNFDDGRKFAFDSELLRVESPSAEIQGHGAAQKTTPSGKRHVTIREIEPVGHYAIRITFSDGHNTGLFTWKTLYEYGLNAETLKADYLARLEEAGLSRD
jgi:DUF971 family protein